LLLPRRAEPAFGYPSTWRLLAVATLRNVGAPPLPSGTDRLTAKDRSLLERARQAAEGAWSPLSHLNVGVVIRARNPNKVFLGCNVEDISQASTVHAEQGALASAVTGRNNRPNTDLVMEIAIFAFDSTTGTLAESSSPCGACRQLLLQFNPNARVLFLQGVEVVDKPLKELLPEAFELPT
jgi:cytidine deaminase